MILQLCFWKKYCFLSKEIKNLSFGFSPQILEHSNVFFADLAVLVDFSIHFVLYIIVNKLPC